MYILTLPLTTENGFARIALRGCVTSESRNVHI